MISGKINPSEAETDIRSIRQTRAGHVWIELGMNSETKEFFRESTKNALVEQRAMLLLRNLLQ